MKNIKYRMKDSLIQIHEQLNYAESRLSNEAIKHIGKELNTQKAWECKGEVEALRMVERIFQENNLPYYEWLD